MLPHRCDRDPVSVRNEMGVAPMNQKRKCDRNGTVFTPASSSEQTPKKMRPYSEILPYTYPALYEGKQSYIGFYVVDPRTGKIPKPARDSGKKCENKCEKVRI